jgi:signal transduction histidine kinase
MLRVVSWTVALAAAAVTVAIVRADPGDSLAGDSVIALAAEVTAGLLLMTAALVTRLSGAFRVLAAFAAVAWLLVEWNSPGADAAFTIGLVLFAAWPPLLAHAGLRYRTRSLSRPAIALIALGYANSLLVLGVGSALFFDPVEQGCHACPANHLLAAARPQVVQDLGRVGLSIAAAWSAAFVALALVRLARATSTRRRVEMPVLLPATAAVALFGARALHGSGRGFLSNDATDRALWAAQVAALALVAAGLLWERLRARRMRGELARLVVELGHSPPPGGLRDRLAETFGDPSLQLLHARDDGSGWLDGDGRPADLPNDLDRHVTRLLAGGRDLAALVHRPGLFEDPALADEVAHAARLALEHERLNAIRRNQLERLRASRARIVATADAERRLLERDLHDGAQQRLATVAVGIRLARRQLASGHERLDAELGAAEDGLREALGELRELAHGLIPSVLAHEGLKPAVEALADRSPRLVVRDLPAERFAAPVESAAYFVVAESLRRSGHGDVAVSARRDNGRLLIDLETAGGSVGSTTDLEDRVGAVGGTLTRTAHHLSVELPCEF